MSTRIQRLAEGRRSHVAEDHEPDLRAFERLTPVWGKFHKLRLVVVELVEEEAAAVFRGKRHRALHGLLIVPHWSKQYRESVEGNPDAFARLQGVESGRHLVAFHDLLAILIAPRRAMLPDAVVEDLAREVTRLDFFATEFTSPPCRPEAADLQRLCKLRTFRRLARLWR